MEVFEQFEDSSEKAPDGSDWIDLDTFPLCDICTNYAKSFDFTLQTIPFRYKKVVKDGFSNLS